jgi:hypothetical protein
VLLKLHPKSRYPDLWFQLLLKFPEVYPSDGPLILLLNPPYHVSVSERGRVRLPEVQEYYDDSLHVFEIVEEVKLLLQKVRRRNRPWQGDDDVVEAPDHGNGISPLEDDNPVDDAHAQAYRDPAKYKALVNEWNAKNGKRSLDEITAGWDVLRAPEAQRRAVAGPGAAPRQYICPISQKLMSDPVHSPTTRYYYEKSALEGLLDGARDAECPMTGKKFTAADRGLAVDAVMEQRIQEFIQRKSD